MQVAMSQIPRGKVIWVRTVHGCANLRSPTDTFTPPTAAKAHNESEDLSAIMERDCRTL